MALGMDKGKVIGFVSAFFLLLLSYLLLYVNTNKMTDQSMSVSHTNEVITNLEFLSSEYKAMEQNFSVFMGSRNYQVKENYYISEKRTDSIYTLIRKLTAGNAAQQLKLDTVKNEIDKKTAYIKQMMDSASAVAPDISVKEFWKNIKFTSNTTPPIIKYIKQMEYYESAVLAQRTQKLEGFNSSILTINLVSLIIALILAIYSIYTYIKENQARQTADEKAEQYKIELETRIKELAHANVEIKELRNTEKFASTGRIARTIAHEIRNPLTNINLAIEQLKESNPATEENNMLLEMVKRNSLRINQLISDLLNATKFSELNFKKTSLNLIIDRALELANDRISLKHIKIEKHYANDICDILVDEEKIQIAFLNIIVNAIEAMEPEKGFLKITTENIHEKCRIIFEDNGIGMNEETLSKLFEPFFTNKEKGTGLGLANTQNIILNHKGKIEVESAEGKGSIFKVTLDLS